MCLNQFDILQRISRALRSQTVQSKASLLSRRSANLPRSGCSFLSPAHKETARDKHQTTLGGIKLDPGAKYMWCAVQVPCVFVLFVAWVCASMCFELSYDILQFTLNIYHAVVPARSGAEVALGLYYKTFLIYKPCMSLAPARPVRACFVRSCCGVVVQAHNLRAMPAQCNAEWKLSSYFTRPWHFTLHTCTSHSALHLASSHLSSSHFIWFVLFSFISSDLFSHVI